MISKKLQQKLDERKANKTFRQLAIPNNLIDFSSNDYLGFSLSKDIFNKTYTYLLKQNISQNGATGSRLLTGNHKLYNDLETMLCQFHKSESALVFNSGYDANLGFFSSVPQRGDLILYDELIHASIRDGIAMSWAKAYKFKHNNLEDLQQKCQTERGRSPKGTEIYVVTESVFSMDGNSPDLITMSQTCKNHNANLIVDEAHAVGVFGRHGSGMIQELNLEKDIFARIITFGKAMGSHGAAILCSNILKPYLINFARSFIYTTALPPHTLATIQLAYGELLKTKAIKNLHHTIDFFKSEVETNLLQNLFIKSHSAIQCCIIPGDENVKSTAKKLQEQGFNVMPILSPTVSEGQERLRFCLHAYNSKKEISQVLNLLTTFVQKIN